MRVSAREQQYESKCGAAKVCTIVPAAPITQLPNIALICADIVAGNNTPTHVAAVPDTNTCKYPSLTACTAELTPLLCTTTDSDRATHDDEQVNRKKEKRHFSEVDSKGS